MWGHHRYKKKIFNTPFSSKKKKKQKNKTKPFFFLPAHCFHSDVAHWPSLVSGSFLEITPSQGYWKKKMMMILTWNSYLSFCNTTKKKWKCILFFLYLASGPSWEMDEHWPSLKRLPEKKKTDSRFLKTLLN